MLHLLARSTITAFAFVFCFFLQLAQAEPSLKSCQLHLSSHKSLETKLRLTPWNFQNPPVLLADGKTPQTLAEAAAHQILPSEEYLRFGVLNFTESEKENLEDELDLVTQNKNLISNIANIEELSTYTGTVRLEGIFIKGISQYSQEKLFTLVRKLKRSVLSSGILAFEILNSELDILLATAESAKLNLFRITNTGNGKLAVIFEKKPEHRQVIFGSTSYYRRYDGLNVTQEMLRRFEAQLKDTKAAVTYRPELDTAIVHHKNGEVLPKSKFIAIALHGAGSQHSNSGSWIHNVPTFEAIGGSLIAPDVPGASLAPGYDGANGYIEHVHRIIEHYKKTYNLPIVLVGRSFGSTMARELSLKYPNDANVIILGSYSNPFTTPEQIENLKAQERRKEITIFWPSLQGYVDITKDIRKRLRQRNTQYPSKNRNGQTNVFYIQGDADQDGGNNVIEDLKSFTENYDQDAEKFFIPDLDHFIFNPKNVIVRQQVFPYLQAIIHDALGIESP